MRKINKIRIFANENEESYKIKLKLQGVLEKYKFEVVEEDYDLAIAIGGYGSFLRMKDYNFIKIVNEKFLKD